MTEKEPAKAGLAERITELLGLKPGQANMVKLIAVALVLGILFMNAGDLFGVTETRRPPNATAVVAPPEGEPVSELTRLEEHYAERLAQKLQAIAGAGRVEVSVTLEAGPSIAVVADTRVDRTNISETATEGSTRRTETVNTHTTHVLQKSGSEDSPVVAKESRAQIAGILIVAEGAGNMSVRQRLHEAAMIAYGIPGHRIQVVPGTGGR